MIIEAPDPVHIWVFGFGSLMWKPGFVPIERHPALLRGFERRFNIWSTKGRGTEKHPGLTLCLEPAIYGRCKGIVYKISPKTRIRDLKYLWDREMTSGVYNPKWITVELDDGSELRTLTWVVNKFHSRYAGPRSAAEMAKIMAHSKGKYGTCRDYLVNTIKEMAKIGECDPKLNEVLELIENNSSLS
tara:strand:+ start:687 stop:1247 length:561 start_codon:yes stop_codon:yes gene_type:complete